MPLSRISVDPGLRGTGWALWDEDLWGACRPPYAHGIYYPADSSGKEWVARSLDLTHRLASLMATNAVHVCYCEFPMRFDSGVGHAASSGKISDIGKLTFLVGCLAESCRREDVEFIPVPVNDWKANLPKEVVDLRLSRVLGQPRGFYDTHSSDACGIGLWAKGFLHASQSTGDG